MQHIAYVIEEGKLGGPQVYIILLARSLSGILNNTIVMPLENSSFFQKKCDDHCVLYKTLPITRITKEWKVALRYLFFFPSEILQLVLYFNQKNFDIIYVSGGSWQYKGVIAGRLAGKKVLWHLNDTSMPYLFRKLFSLFSPLVDGFIYASERTKQYYGPLKTRGKAEFVIPAPVDVIQFDPTLSINGDEELISQWVGKTVIGTVANVSPIKGLELFIRSASLLNKGQKEHLVFVVIGPIFPRQEPYFRRLQKLCNDLSINNIEFVGSRSDIRPLLKRFDVYTCSSLAESSPISVWEALAMGKPVVSTNVGDVPLYVHSGHNGSIIDIGDINAMAEEIAILVKNKELRIKYGENSREIAVKKLDVSKCAERHLSAYNKISGQI